MRAEDFTVGHWWQEKSWTGSSWHPEKISSVARERISFGHGPYLREWNFTLDDFHDHVKPIDLTATEFKEWFGADWHVCDMCGTQDCEHTEITRGNWLMILPTPEGRCPNLQFYIHEESIQVMGLGGFPVRVEYVHELQRLYHALTGQPLERIEQ